MKVTAVPLAGTYPADGSFAISVKLENTAAVPINRIGLQVVVYAAAGKMSCAYSFYSSFRIAPGESRHFLRRPANIRVKPGERVVIRLLAALGENLRWAANPFAAAAVQEGFGRILGSRSQLLPANAQQQACKDACPCLGATELCAWQAIEAEMFCLCARDK